MNYKASHRCVIWLSQIAAKAPGALICAALSSLSVAAPAQQIGTAPPELASSEEILRQAGASSAELAEFEENLREASPSLIGRIERNLRQQSPAELAKTVEGMRYDDQYVLGPDSIPQPGVPKGKLFEFKFDHSTVFPGTTRNITVYVPAEYVGDKPACVYVGLDDLAFKAPTVFDNLIYKHEMPVTIAIGVESGEVDSSDPPRNPRLNRSFEFDSLSSNLARFLLEEVFPEVVRHKTPDGLPILLSGDPNDRAAGGVSSGGIGAFTLAWERPDAFRRVFTAMGSFTGMRGGDSYAVLVRKTEPKPIRVFMQDGSHDIRAELGDWWLSNQAMHRALEFAGYKVEHVWGEGVHGSKQGTVIFPDAMRWLWKNWPEPVRADESQSMFLKAILRPGEGWQAVPGTYKSASSLASDRTGAVMFWDVASGKTWSVIGDGQVRESTRARKPFTSMAFGPDDRAYSIEVNDKRIAAYTREGKSSVVANGIRGANLLVNHRGAIYVTEPGTGEDTGKVWLLKSDGKKLLLDNHLNHPSCIAISPDGLWLTVVENRTHWGYSYRIQPDGSVQERQPFYRFDVSANTDDSGVGACVMDRDGRLYVATRLGVQVFDRWGLMRAILPAPGGEVTSLSFGGASFDSLYISCADRKIYRRKLNAVGAPPWAAPTALPEDIN